MTDTHPPTPDPAETVPQKKKKPRRTWRQRFKILFLVVLIGLCLFRIALNVLLPTVIDKVAGLFGLEVGYQRLSLSLLGGTAHIWGLEVRPAEGGPSIAKCDYIQGNLAPLELLRARLVVYRAEVDGVDLTVERAADGTLPLLQKFASAQNKTATPVATASPSSNKPMSLEAPLRVDAIRLSHVTATLRDKSVSPVFEATVRTNVRVSDVGLDNGPAKFELDVGVDPLLDTLRVVGEARTSANSLKADVQVLLRGLHPKAAAGYLTPLGLRPVADYITVQANASISAETQPNSPNIKASIALDHMSAITDGQEWASLSSLTLDAKSISPTAIELGKLDIADGFASAKRSSDGRIQMAGLELAPAVAAQPTAPTPQPAPAVVASNGTPLRVALDALELHRLQANIVDQGVTPANSLTARLESLSIKNIDTASPAAVPISLKAGITGLVQQVTVDGQATLFAPTKALTLALRASGIKPDAVQPYLRPFGVQSTLAGATASADVKASLKLDDAGVVIADASASGVKFADGDASLIELNTAGFSGVSFNPKNGAIGIKSIVLSGPELAVARESDGAISLLGLRYAPPAAKAAAASTPSSTPTPATTSTPAPATAVAPLSLPRIEVNQFNWSGLKLTLEDRAASPAEKFVVQDAGVEVKDLLVDLAATNKQNAGSFRAYLMSPGLAASLSAEGTFTPDPGRFSVEATIDGAGLSGAPLANYLRPFGVEPTLAHGKLHARAAAALAQTDGKLSADLDLSDLTYADGETELAGVGKLHVGSLVPSSSRIDLAELTMTKPRAKVAREADGTLAAGGIRLVAAQPTTQPAAQPAAQIASPTTAPAPSRPAAMLRALPIELGIAKLSVENAALDISDAAAPAGATNIRFVGGVTLNNLDVSPAAKPANLHATASVDGALRQATIDGTLTASPVAPAIDLTITADGLAAGPLVSYLPPTIHPTLAGGTFTTKFSGSATNHDAGGLSAKLNVHDLKLADASGTLAKVDDFTLAADRVDPAAEIFSLAELTTAGVAADVKQTPAGEIEAAGIRLVAAPPATAQPPVAPTAAAAPATAPAEPAASVAQMVNAARRPLPFVSIGKLSLGVGRLGLAGFTGPDAAPVELKDLLVTSPGPIRFGGKRADADAPLELSITGGVAPIVSTFDVKLSVKPLANEPSLGVDVAAAGIRGEGLLAVLPALKEKIDGSQLNDGQFNTHLDATVNYGRRGPRDLDLGRGFTAEFNLKPLEFRGQPGGPVLAGVGGVHGEGIRIEPAKSNVLIKTIDITTPIFHAYRENDGIHAAGLVVKLAPDQPVESLAPASQPATQPVTTPETVAAAPASAPAAAQRPANELRIDHLTVSGIDCRIEDRTTKPATIVPIRSLDVDVRNLSNQLPWNGKSVRFSVLMTSDKVPLPPRKGISGTATTRQGDRAYTEDRELFSQITANGKVGFARQGDVVALDGWTKTAVNGFELLGVRGLAQTFGVTIGGGAFDDTNDVRFRPDGEIETRSKIVFTNLSLSEAADGPLQKLFKLPAPIDVAIGAVTDPDGSITLNLPVPIKNGAVTAGDVVGPALGAVTNVLVTGIASAPLKAVSGVGGLLGLGGKDAAPEAPILIGYLPAYDGLDSDGQAAIAQLVKALKDDDALELQLRHSLSDEDVARTGGRVNPSPEQALALAAQVRQQKVDLLLKHDTLAAQARGDLGANATAQAKSTLDALRTISQQIAKADTALDDLYALTGPSAAQQTDRRTRAASLDLARRRLESIKTVLSAAGVKDAEGRVHATNPQFDPAPEAGGGYVSITLVRKKH